jgi:rhodanese-related sulfurtransferase
MTTHHRGRMLLLAFLLCAAAAACGGQEPASEAVSPSELAARIQSDAAPLILDVRTPAEFESGHIPGAVNIPHDQLRDRLDELSASPNDEIVVHCERGGRAAAAEAVLREAGYTHVRDLSGHMRAWRAEDLPVE